MVRPMEPPADKPAPAARDRILETAYDLFGRHGIRAVGIDRIIAESGVAKMTLYRHFASKEDLVLAFLALRGERWTEAWLRDGVEAASTVPHDRLLAVFDVLDGWFRLPHYEGCSFANTLLEFSDANSRIHQEAARQLEAVRSLVERFARDAGLPDPAEVASLIQILMLGAIVSASRGDREAGRRARRLAVLLLDDLR
jgi:AcrR family transcriptional regulator